ncbi:MAG: hypothetical protein HGA94_03410 [Candidatus Aminicenantes bacterium]|jgi:hypothetical protein|nr:hypothetical protein [Candidatus Aminicenantes bacterium]
MQHAQHEQRQGHGVARGHRPAKGNGKSAVPTCPYCNEKDEVIPILYGFPTHAGFLKAERGEVYLGGCEITPYGHYCKRDDREF